MVRLVCGHQRAKGLNASFKTQLRAGYDGLILSAWNHDLELTYKLTDRFRVEATYRLGNSYNLETGNGVTVNWASVSRIRWGMGGGLENPRPMAPCRCGPQTGDLSRSLTWATASLLNANHQAHMACSQCGSLS